MKTLGQANYEAYFQKALGASLGLGIIVPKWDEQSDQVKQAWQAGAEAAVESFIEVKNAPEPQMHRDETLFPRGDAQL